MPDKAEEKTAGGLVLPPSSIDDQKPETATVLKLGDGKLKDGTYDFKVKVGDRVYFKKYSPDELEVDGEKYLLVDGEDILAVLD